MNAGNHVSNLRLHPQEIHHIHYSLLKPIVDYYSLVMKRDNSTPMIFP